MQTATNDDSSPAAPPAAKKQKIGNTNSANASEFDNDDVEEEMRQLDLDSLDLSTTGRIEIPEWGTADKDWSCLGLQKKLELYDLLVKMIAKKPEGQSIRNFIGATACMSVNTYHDWNREDKAEAIRAAIKEVPGRGFQSRIFGFDWRQYRPQNSVSDREEVTITEEAEEKMLEEEAKDNARLTLAALKDHVPSNVTVIDGTSGERIFLSDEQTTELFTCVLVDKYKNEVRNCNKYKGVLSYNCDEFRQYVSSRVAMAFIWDPPYRTINGGHTVVNCTMSKSQSRIRFNNAYGVEYKYTNEMINAMYLRGFYWANQLLHEDGVFLVKCMHENDGVAQLQAVIEMGQLYDFCLKGSYTLKSRTTTKDSSKCNDSFLLVMKRNTNLKSLKDFYPLAEAAEYKEKMTRYINNSAAAAYLEATTKSLKDGKGWLHACLKLEKGLSEEQKRKAFKDIREEVIHSSESFHSMDSKIRKEMNQITTAITSGVGKNCNHWHLLRIGCFST